jgi:DNA-binding response OmpR family regulator
LDQPFVSRQDSAEIGFASVHNPTWGRVRPSRIAAAANGTMRVLIVEDHTPLRDSLSQELSRNGFTTDTVASVEAGRAALLTDPFDVVLLDLGLPDGDGLSLIRWCRDRGNKVPILITTARDAVADRVRGLDAGADDYLVKPFAMEELQSRIRALLRRPGALLGAILSYGDITFDSNLRHLTIGEQAALMSNAELIVLERLLRGAGRVVSKDIIERDLYGFAGRPSSNAIEVFLHRLRKRLEASGSTCLIHTVRGVGYMLVKPSTERTDE